ncbi:MAG: matrixin family metalloprotease [Thermoanaerobaculia bacterium]|nr:matrixin family metalloprotease [Thermoanaerobaculia bacterium]
MSQFAKSSKLATVVLAGAAMIVAAAPSHAYRMIQNTTVGRVSAGAAVTCSAAGGFAHWGTANIPWRLNTAGQGSGKATAISNALAAWTAVTSANHNLTYAGTTTTGFSTNGTNTVLWATGNGCTGSCLAITALVLQSGQVIVETDISFNASYTWNTNGSDYDVEAVAAHEFGHALGIHHTNLTSTPRPTMYASYFGTTGRTLETDDRSALQCAQSRYPI